MRWWSATLLALALVSVGAARGARACSPGQAPAPTAIPRTGTSDVSTATSIVVASPLEPFGVSVMANGQPVAVTGWTALGAGVDGDSGPTRFWQLSVDGRPASFLTANSDYVVTLPGAGSGAAADASAGGGATLTAFSTGPGYDKTAGTPADLRSLHLWRVRYPVDDIASGNCVFAEYASFVTVDYDAAILPDTAPGSVIQTFQLVPETGGPSQTFVYTGDAPFAGLAPTGSYPLPLGDWQPNLDPSRRYCLTVNAIGDGNLARLGAASNQICADVVQLSASGAPPPPPASASGGSGGGCAVSDAPVRWLGLGIAAAAIGLASRRRSGRRRSKRA